MQLPALLRDALVDIRHTFLPQNWPVLVYSAVLIPFTSFFLTSNYITQFAVPEYLLGVLRTTTRYHALYLAIVVLLANSSPCSSTENSYSAQNAVSNAMTTRHRMMAGETKMSEALLLFR